MVADGEADVAMFDLPAAAAIVDAAAGPLDGGAAQRHRADRRRAAEGLAQHRGGRLRVCAR